MKRIIAFLFVAVSLFTSAREPLPQPAGSCPEFRELSRAVKDLAAVVEASVKQQEEQGKLQLAIAYLQFRFRRIESLEQEVRRAVDEKGTLESYLTNMQERLVAMEERYLGMSGEEADELQREIDRYKAAAKTMEDRIMRAQQKIMDMENDIEASRDQVESFEYFILDNLDIEP